MLAKLVGTFPGYCAVWYHPEGIANVLSLARVRKKYIVTNDSTSGHGFIVHSPNRPTFEETEGSLYAYDMSKLKTGAHLLANVVTIGKDKGHGIRVVEENEKKYMDRDVKRADRARRFQKVSGSSLTTFLDVVDNNLLKTNLITRNDGKMTEDIYGTCVSNLQGKTARRKVPHVKLEIKMVPQSIMDKY